MGLSAEIHRNTQRVVNMVSAYKTSYCLCQKKKKSSHQLSNSVVRIFVWIFISCVNRIYCFCITSPIQMHFMMTITTITLTVTESCRDGDGTKPILSPVPFMWAEALSLSFWRPWALWINLYSWRDFKTPGMNPTQWVRLYPYSDAVMWTILLFRMANWTLKAALIQNRLWKYLKDPCFFVFVFLPQKFKPVAVYLLAYYQY